MSLSVDKRLISDPRRINLNFDSRDFYHAAAPHAILLAEETIRSKFLIACTPVIMCKRDVSVAFIALYLHPAICVAL